MHACAYEIRRMGVCDVGSFATNNTNIGKTTMLWLSCKRWAGRRNICFTYKFKSKDFDLEMHLLKLNSRWDSEETFWKFYSREK